MKQIFIVEDDDGIRELIELVLVSENYSVRTFPNVRSFQESISGARPDLFLLDIMLPDGNGLDLCKEIKNNELTEDIPVMFMSAHADIRRMEGADGVISKPFDVDELLQSVRKQLKEV